VKPAARVVSMLLVWGALLGWHLSADGWGCIPAAMLLALLAALMALAGTEAAFYRRHAFLRHYLEPDGRLFGLLRRRLLILIRQGIVSLALALFLLIGALGFGESQWLLLLADIVLLTVLQSLFSSLLAGEVREPYPAPMARQWAERVNGVLLWLAWSLLMFFSPHADYAGLRWEEVVAHSAHATSVGCDALAVSARLAAAGQSLALWGAQHLFRGLQEPVQLLMAWVAFLTAFGASYFVARAFSRALSGVSARPWAV
jgi:hypothetical protein